jgi:putative heme-binding domain-containing protein
VRAAGGQKDLDAAVREKALALCHDTSADVRLQVAIVARRLAGARGLTVMLETLAGGDDPSELLPRIVWRNLEPALAAQSGELVGWMSLRSRPLNPAMEEIVARSFDRLLAGPGKADAAFDLVAAITERPDTRVGLVGRCFETFLDRALSGEVPRPVIARFRQRFASVLAELSNSSGPQAAPAVALATMGGDPPAAKQAARMVLDPNGERLSRQRLFRALVTADADAALATAAELLSPRREDPDAVLTDVLASLSRGTGPDIARSVIATYPELRPAVRPQALDLLTSRKTWAASLLAAIQSKKIAAAEVNANQIRKILAFGDPSLTRAAQALWGHVRSERNPDREQLIAKMRLALAGGPATPTAGAKVFERVCGQCHKLNGVGNEVGPDLTGVGRANLDQLLSNLLDPNLVIGRDYQATIVAVDDGQVVTGLLVEDSPTRVVLKVAGGKLEVFPRDRVEETRRSEVSLMPEDLEKQVTEQEFRDLIAYLRATP